MQVVLAAVLPVLLMALLGYVLARMGRPVEGATLRFLVAEVGSPALIFTALLKNDLAGSMLAGYAGATVVGLAVTGLVAWAVLRLYSQSVRAFLPAMMFGNTGNLGLPLALYACGPQGLGYAAVLHSVIAVTNFTLGQSIAVGRTHWRALVTNPPLIAAILGVSVSAFHITLPLWLRNTLDLPSSFTIPLMLMMLGTSLATIRVGSMTRTVALSALRIALGIGVGFGVSALFGMSGIPRAVFVLQFATPVAVYNYLFALVAKTDPEGVASVVVVSTLMSVATIPVLLLVLV